MGYFEDQDKVKGLHLLLYKNQAIHNYLLSLYAKLQSRKLMGYFEDQDKERGLHSLLYKNQAIHNYVFSVYSVRQTTAQEINGIFRGPRQSKRFTLISV